MKITRVAPQDDERGGKRRKPVPWLSVTELIRTGSEAAKSTDFARYADQRETQAHSPEQFYDLSHLGTADPFVVDYLADTGDGFDATFAVAASVNGTAQGPAAPRERGDLLVLGGDEVYPVGSVRTYADRLRLPFRQASPPVDEDDPRRLVLALPGNHDWYDGLGAFRRMFCEGWLAEVGPNGWTGLEGLVPVSVADLDDPLLGRWTFQSRSYWAVRLPHGWWLWGLDSQLDSHIDAVQLAYFLRARDQVLDGERVILCTARPSWTDLPARDQGYWDSNREVLTWFVDRMFGRSEDKTRPERRHQVPVLLTGDKHHYVHFERTSQDPETPVHLVTCGGGGAYLSSTHHVAETVEVPWDRPASEDVTTYQRTCTFPSVEESEALRWRWNQIPFLNGWVTPLLVGAIDLLLTALLFLGLDVGTVAGWVPFGFAALLLFVLLGAMSTLFRKPGVKKRVGVVPGIVHACVHAGLVTLGALGFSDLLSPLKEGYDGLWAPDLPFAGSFGSLVFVGLYCLVFGNAVFAVYFLVCDLVKFHENEFFSAMQIADYKSHLRLTFTPPAGDEVAGSLVIEVLGIPSVPHQGETADPRTVHVQHVETFTV